MVGRRAKKELKGKKGQKRAEIIKKDWQRIKRGEFESEQEKF